MNLIRSLLTAIAASVAFYYMLDSALVEKVLSYSSTDDSTPFLDNVLHFIITTLLGTLCIFLSMFLLKERRKENISLIIVGVWAQTIIIGSLASWLAFSNLLAGAALYVINVSFIAPNFTDYKNRIFSIVNRTNHS